MRQAATSFAGLCLLALSGVAAAADTQAPTVPTGLTATRIWATQINLKWNPSTDNVGVQGYRVERCQGTNCTSFKEIATTQTASLNNADAALTPTSSFSYRVRAVDKSGNLSGYSAKVTVAATSTSPTSTTDTSKDTQPPTVPTGLTATRASAQQINLKWNASTDNVGVQGYRIERCQGTGCTSFQHIATTLAPSLSNWDAALVPSSSFTYRVRAVDKSGNLSGYSAKATVAASATSTTDTKAPTVPTGLTATRVWATQINLKWNASTDNVGVQGYRIERCQGTSCTSFQHIATTLAPALNNADAALTPGSGFSYRVRAVDKAGNLSGYSATVKVPAWSSSSTPQPPVISGTPATSVIAGNSYSFTPTASDPDGQPLTFKISGMPSWATFSTSTGTLKGTPSASAVGTYSNIVISVTDGTHTKSLPAFSIAVVQSGTRNVTLMWTPPVTQADGKPLTDLAGYDILVGTTTALETRKITVNNAGIASYVVDGLTPGVTWYFGIRAFDKQGNRSGLSSVISRKLQ